MISVGLRIINVFQITNGLVIFILYPIADPDLFEGDIVMTKSLQTDIDNMEYAAKNKISKFDAITNGAWSKGVIPYTFARNFSKLLSPYITRLIAAPIK